MWGLFVKYEGDKGRTWVGREEGGVGDLDRVLAYLAKWSGVMCSLGAEDFRVRRLTRTEKAAIVSDITY